MLRLRIQGQVFMTPNEASNLLLEWAQELDQQLSKVDTRPTPGNDLDIHTPNGCGDLECCSVLHDLSLSLSLSLSPPVSRLQS